MRLAPLLLLLSVTTATAQETESVTVNASAMVGVWKITRPSYIAKRGLFGAIEFGPPAAGFCRIEQADGLTFHCLNSGSGTVTLDGHNIHFAQGIMIARIVLEGTLDSGDGFTGHMAIKLAGITTEDPNVSSGGKLDLSKPQTGPADALLHTMITNASVEHDAGAKDRPTLPSDLGGVQALIWLGSQDKGGGPDQQAVKNYFSVYAVEFDHGERLCSLHQREDGALDAFLCV